MTTFTTTPQVRTGARVRTAIVWLATGGLLGAVITTSLTDEPVRPAVGQTATEAPGIAAVTVSATAAERWALADLHARHLACGETHWTPDAVERCTR